MPVIEREVTDTYTSPDGFVVVVTGVPAYVHVDEAGHEEITYDFEVAEKLDAFNLTALSQGGEPGEVKHFRYSEQVKMPIADLRFRIVGEGIHFSSTPLKVWKKAFDRIYHAYTSLSKTLAKFMDFSNNTGPTVEVGSGSLVISLRGSDEQPLMPDLVNQYDITGQTLTLLMDASKWLESGDEDTLPELMKNEEVFDAALRAVEDIAPSERDEAKSIELLSDSQGKRSRTRLTPTTRRYAIEKRVAFAVKKQRAQRLEFEGQLYSLNIDNIIVIRNINTQHGDVKLSRISLIFKDNLRDEVINCLGQNVRVVSLYHRSRPKKQYELISFVTSDLI